MKWASRAIQRYLETNSWNIQSIILCWQKEKIIFLEVVNRAIKHFSTQVFTIVALRVGEKVHFPSPGQAWDPRPCVLVLEDQGQWILCPHAVLVLVALYFTMSSSLSSRTGKPFVSSWGQHTSEECVISSLFSNEDSPSTFPDVKVPMVPNPHFSYY